VSHLITSHAQILTHLTSQR